MLKKLIFILIFVFMLSSCRADHDMHTSTSESATSPIPDTVPQANTAANVTVGTTKSVRVYEKTITHNNTDYVFIMVGSGTDPILDRTFSETSHVILPGFLDKIGTIRIVALGDSSQLPNISVLTVGEGVELIIFGDGADCLASIERLELPSTLISWESYRNTDDTGTFPTTFSMLKTIDVCEENLHFKSIDGLLYEKDNSQGINKFRLKAVPQNYSTDDQIIVLPDNTNEITPGAVYHCRNIKKIAVPDSVIMIGDRAITATAEHPLTVVCSRGSAAAAYVEEFGEQYHLTVEFTD